MIALQSKIHQKLEGQELAHPCNSSASALEQLNYPLRSASPVLHPRADPKTIGTFKGAAPYFLLFANSD